jgi:hypothetical protein
MDILAPEIVSLLMECRKQNGNLLKNGYQSFDNVSVVYGGHLGKKMLRSYLEENNCTYTH